MFRLLVWKSESVYEKVKSVREVWFNSSTAGYGVSFNAYSIGPRGGYGTGIGPGFSFDEWESINKLLTAIRAGVEQGFYAEFQPGTFSKLIVCTLCDETFYPQYVLDHQRDSKHAARMVARA